MAVYLYWWALHKNAQLTIRDIAAVAHTADSTVSDGVIAADRYLFRLAANERRSWVPPLHVFFGAGIPHTPDRSHHFDRFGIEVDDFGREAEDAAGLHCARCNDGRLIAERGSRPPLDQVAEDEQADQAPKQPAGLFDMCGWCHRVHPMMQERLNRQLNAQDVAESAAAINWRETDPGKQPREECEQNGKAK